MSTYDYVIINSNCGVEYYNHHHARGISDINGTVKNALPKGAVISNVEIYLDSNFDSVFGTLGSPTLYFYFCPNDESKYNTGEQLYKGTVGKNSTISRKDITSYVTKTYPFSINTSYPVLSLYYASTTKRLYHDDLWKIIYTYSVPKYTLTVTAGTGGTVSGGGSYDNQTTVTLTATPNAGYKFVKWNDDANAPATRTVTVTGNATYTATFQPITYTVTFKDENGATLKTETVNYGSTVTAPSDPVKADTAQWDYTFDGWYDANGNKWTSSTTITGDTVFAAQYAAVVQKYTVRWFNYDGTLLETDTGVPYGTKPVYNGDEPQRAGNAEHSYQFAGWNYDTENGITPSLGATYIDITAQFREIDNTYKVTWVNDGSVIETDEAVPYGDKPDYNGSTPTKPSDAQYDYDFIGWSTSVTDPPKAESELDVVKGDITYTAVYSATLRMYPVTVILFDSEVTSVYEYGTEVTIEAPAVVGYKFTQWSDGNTDNPRTVEVTGEATYQAVYERIPFPIMVNNEQVTGVYIVPTTQTVVYVINGEVPAVVANGVTVDDWSFEVSNSVPDNSYPIEKLYINETRVY